MVFLDIIGIGVTIIVAIFVIFFTYLITKWCLKKAKTMQKKFEHKSRKKKTQRY